MLRHGAVHGIEVLLGQSLPFLHVLILEFGGIGLARVADPLDHHFRLEGEPFAVVRDVGVAGEALGLGGGRCHGGARRVVMSRRRREALLVLVDAPDIVRHPTGDGVLERACDGGFVVVLEGVDDVLRPGCAVVEGGHGILRHYFVLGVVIVAGIDDRHEVRVGTHLWCSQSVKGGWILGGDIGGSYGRRPGAQGASGAGISPGSPISGFALLENSGSGGIGGPTRPWFHVAPDST